MNKFKFGINSPRPGTDYSCGGRWGLGIRRITRLLTGYVMCGTRD